MYLYAHTSNEEAAINFNEKLEILYVRCFDFAEERVWEFMNSTGLYRFPIGEQERPSAKKGEQ